MCLYNLYAYHLFSLPHATSLHIYISMFSDFPFNRYRPLTVTIPRVFAVSSITVTPYFLTNWIYICRYVQFAYASSSLKYFLLQYRQAVKSPPPFALQQKQRSFLTFGFGAGPARRESHVNVNVTPTSHDLASDTPEIRKYKKRFNSEILCAALWGK